jgi:hypothetical protein
MINMWDKMLKRHEPKQPSGLSSSRALSRFISNSLTKSSECFRADSAQILAAYITEMSDGRTLRSEVKGIRPLLHRADDTSWQEIFARCSPS